MQLCNSELNFEPVHNKFQHVRLMRLFARGHITADNEFLMIIQSYINHSYVTAPLLPLPHLLNHLVFADKSGKSVCTDIVWLLLSASFNLPFEFHTSPYHLPHSPRVYFIPMSFAIVECDQYCGVTAVDDAKQQQPPRARWCSRQLKTAHAIIMKSIMKVHWLGRSYSSFNNQLS